MNYFFHFLIFFVYILKINFINIKFYKKENYIYKYETNNPVQIHEKIQIPNVAQKLKEIGIKLIGLKRK